MKANVVMFPSRGRRSRAQRMDPSPKLTPRQREVAALLAEGYTIQNVAMILNISPRTVEAHQAAIRSKLGVLNSSELTLKAIKIGLIECPCPEHQTLRRAA